MKGILHEDQLTILSYLTHLFLEWEMFQTNLVEKIETHVLCWITFFFFENRAVYEIMWKKCCRTGDRWQYGACALHAGYLRLQIHTNTHCFSTATVVHERASVFRYTYVASLVNFPLAPWAYSSCNTVKMVQSRRAKWEERLSCMKKWKAPTECCLEYLKRTNHLGDTGEDVKVILKCVFEVEVLKPPANYTQMNNGCFKRWDLWTRRLTFGLHKSTLFLYHVCSFFSYKKIPLW